MSAAVPGGGIGVVVVTHHSASTILPCLHSVLASPGVVAVAVVDNASLDDTCALVSALAAREPRLRLLANARNRGFSKGCNQGAAALDARWLAFVNPDCELPPEALARLCALAEASADAGLLGADLVDDTGFRDPAARRAEPSLARMLSGAGAGRTVAVPIDTRLPLQRVDAVSGALMLMPRALFSMLGGFDEGYRLHAEDLDLCRRVRDAGHGVYVANEVRVLHHRGVSSRRRPMWVELQKHRGIHRYYRKFEAGNDGWHRRAFAAVAIWTHFLVAAPRAWWRERQRRLVAG